MISARQRAMNTVRHFRIAPSRIAKLRDEKTLHVTGAPTVWPADYVAQYCKRVALENGCTRISVHQGTRTPVDFDVMELFTRSRQLTLTGELAVPTMKVVPPDLATKGFASVGSYTDEKKTFVVVPSLTRVSGLTGTKGAF